ncbi:MAG: hypothetical protein U5R46_06300 [Gammaproteobacteria bacterium]|nr:hypothetical protein [Gammaproteobacteria bacterium]
MVLFEIRNPVLTDETLLEAVASFHSHQLEAGCYMDAPLRRRIPSIPLPPGTASNSVVSISGVSAMGDFQTLYFQYEYAAHSIYRKAVVGEPPPVTMNLEPGIPRFLTMPAGARPTVPALFPGITAFRIGDPGHLEVRRVDFARPWDGARRLEIEGANGRVPANSRARKDSNPRLSVGATPDRVKRRYISSGARACFAARRFRH